MAQEGGGCGGGCGSPPSTCGAETVPAFCDEGIFVANILPGDCVRVSAIDSRGGSCPTVSVSEEAYPYNLTELSQLPWSQIPDSPAGGYRRTIGAESDPDFRYEARELEGGKRDHLICARPTATAGIHQGYLGRALSPEDASDSGRLGGVCKVRTVAGVEQDVCYQGLSLRDNTDNGELACLPFETEAGSTELRCAPKGEPVVAGPTRVPRARADAIIEQGRHAFALVRITVGSESPADRCTDAGVGPAPDASTDGGPPPSDAGTPADSGPTSDAGPTDSGPAPDAASPFCGDTMWAGPPVEECEDGNNTPGDGCSSECKIEVGWDCVFPTPCARLPAVTVGPAYISPELPPGVTTHFTGVTQFILAELSSADATLSVASCTDSLGACTTDPFDVSPAFGSPPTAEITLPFLMGEDTFDFELEASMHGATSDPYPLEVILQAGDGELKCEQWTNGLPGSDEQRRFGLRLEAEGGAPILEADYYIYQRLTDDQGWPKFRDPDVGASSAEVLGNSTSLSIDANFLVIAVDRGSTPPAAVAARQFRWDDPPHMRTQGCMPCSRGAGGSCRIIPWFRGPAGSGCVG